MFDRVSCMHVNNVISVVDYMYFCFVLNKKK